MRITGSSTFGITLCALAGLTFFIVVAAYRVPFLSNVLVGEEGTHAYLVTGPQPVIVGDDALLIARLNGKDILAFVERNILLYQFLDVVARRAGQLLPLCHESTIACVSLRARAPFLIVFLAGLLVALFGVRRYLACDRPRVLMAQFLILFYVLSAPLLVGGSVQPQIDGALGVLIAAMSASILLSLKRRAPPFRYIAAFVGGAAGALGKNEWAIALAASAATVAALSAGLTLAVKPNQRDWRAVRQGLAVCITIVTGIIVCQWLLYLYSPRTFMGGIDVMFRIAGMRLSIVDQLTRGWGLAHPVFLACGLMLVLITVRLKEYCLQQPSLVVVAGWAAIIVVGYVYSGFSGDGFQRYYCPPAMLASLALVCLIGDLAFSRVAFGIASGVLILGIGANSVSLVRSYSQGLTITSGPGSSLAAIESRYATLASRYARVPIFEWSAIGIYYSNVDWVATDLGIGEARGLLQKMRPNRPPELVIPSN